MSAPEAAVQGIRTKRGYTREEAALLYGVSLDTIRRAINKGELRAKRIGSAPGEGQRDARPIRISDEALRKWWDSLPDA